MSRKNFLLVDTEIQALLDKGVIKMVDLGEDKYLSSIFLAEKERFKPEASHQCEKHEPACPLRTFQNVGIIFFKRAPEKRGFSLQSGLERCILCCCITQSIREFCIFRVERQIYQFVCLCFGLAPAPLVFTKLMEISIAIIRILNGRILIYLDNILIITEFNKELLVLRHTLIFLLQNLGFVINFKNSVLDLCHVLEFQGQEINSLHERVELLKEKVEKIKKQCQYLILLKKVSVRDLAKLTERLSSTAMAVLSAPLQHEGVQQEQITGLSMRGSYEDTIVLRKEAKVELDWWMQNMDLNNGRCILSTPPQIVMQSDASKLG